MTVPFFVVNPTSGGGRLRKAWPGIADKARELLGPIEFEETRNAGEATEIARRAAEAGHQLIVACGGDGTHNEVVNGLIRDDEPILAEQTLGMLPFGTGGDLRKTTGLMGDIGEHLRVLRDGSDVSIDLGRIDFIDHDDAAASRYFINIASAGLGGKVDMIVNRSSKRLKGRMSFFLATVRALAGYTYPEVELTLDDGPIIVSRVANIAVANGQFFGGGMHVAPKAKMNDGELDVIVMHKTGLINSAISMPDLYRGTHLRRPWVTMKRASRVMMTSDEEVLLDVDGEAPGKLPATFTLLKSALKIRIDPEAAGWGA